MSVSITNKFNSNIFLDTTNKKKLNIITVNECVCKLILYYSI